MAKAKHPGGRPAKYKTPEALAKAIDAYFKDEEHKPFALAELAYVLGFEDRHGFSSQAKRGRKYSTIIKRARIRVEMQHEKVIAKPGKPTGSIFWLKNHAGYRDSTDIVHDVSDPIKELLKEIAGQGTGRILNDNCGKATR